MYPLISDDVLFIEESEYIFAVKPLQELIRLNSAGAKIWKHCNGSLSIKEIIAQVAQQEGHTQEVAATIVIPFIRDLNTAGYIVFSNEPLPSYSAHHLDWFSKSIDEFLSELQEMKR